MEDHELLESIRGISRGMEQAKRGEGKPMREFLESLAEEIVQSRQDFLNA